MPQTILIADDDPSIRLWLACLLQEAGYGVISVGTLEEGKAALGTGEPDLLIADVRLGAFNGLQLVAMSRGRIPAIVLTGYDDPVLHKDAAMLGAEFLLKPTGSAELLRVVAEKLRT